jgi:hypothetical protein
VVDFSESGYICVDVSIEASKLRARLKGGRGLGTGIKLETVEKGPGEGENGDN